MDEKSAQALQETMFRKVYVPELLKSAAARGIPVNTEEDISELLKIATMLRIHATKAAEQEQAKGQSLLKTASSRLAEITFGDQEKRAEYLGDGDLVKVLNEAGMSQ